MSVLGKYKRDWKYILFRFGQLEFSKRLLNTTLKKYGKSSIISWRKVETISVIDSQILKRL